MTRIPVGDDASEFFDSPHDYGTIEVQGGEDGTVFAPSGSYMTAFVECFPEGSFLRGEGASLAEADEACWAKLQAHTSCEHQWEVRGYRNGGGVCKHCEGFGHKVFTPAELGLGCTICGIPTFHTLTGDEMSEEARCEAHDPKWPYFVGYLEASPSRRGDETSRSMYARLSKVANYGGPEDTEALEWAYTNLDMTRAPRAEGHDQ